MVLAVGLGIFFSKKGPISKRNQENLGTLLSDLVKATEEGPGAGHDQIDKNLANIKKTAKRDYALAEAIALYWEKVYLDEDYVLNMYKQSLIGPKPQYMVSVSPSRILYTVIIP